MDGAPVAAIGTASKCQARLRYIYRSMVTVPETTLPLIVALLVISAILAVSASVDFKVRVPPVLSVLPLASNESVPYKFNAPPSVK